MYLKRPNGVMNVVYNWLSSSSGHWWYPFAASTTVKYLTSSAAMSAIVFAGVGD